MDPVDAMTWIRDHMLPQFPLGVYRDTTKEVEPYQISEFEPSAEEIKKLLEMDTESEQKDIDIRVPEKYRNPEIKVAGFGGQGVLLLGAALAQAGMLADLNVSWLPSYGPEMRGGTANCHVNVRDIAVGSPVVNKPTVLIAMNRPSLEKFEAEVQEGGLILYDSSLIDIDVKRSDVEVLPIPATEMADKLGNTRTANMITMAAYAGYSGLFSREILFETLNTAIKRKKLIEVNKKAIEVGYEFGMKHKKVD
jgi:Pyruvate/2-oxoacid:ferredoxin oxidoreductase gamma subunit